MIDTAIIADDLTGACDSGVKLTNLGYETQVIINAGDTESLQKNGGHIFSINTDTRSMSPEEAYFCVKQVVEDMKKNGINRFYKKIDSVFRGNIGREIDAMFDAMDYQIAVITPALPDNGRIIKNGKLYECSEFSQDEKHSLIIKDVLHSSSVRQCGSVNLSVIRQGKEAVKSEIKKLYTEGNTLILLDTEENSDLELISRAISEIDLRILPVGSAGLIRYIWPLWDDNDCYDAKMQVNEAEEVRILLVAGSIHPATIAQIQMLNNRDDISIYTYPVKDINSKNASGRVDSLLNSIKSDFNGKTGSLAIVVTTERILKRDFSDEERMIYKDISNQMIAEGIAEIANQLVEPLRINRLIATGGDIASYVFNKVGIRQIRLLAEPIPGIVAGIATLSSGKKLLLATKSGGFGDERALEKLINYMYSAKFTN